VVIKPVFLTRSGVHSLNTTFFSAVPVSSKAFRMAKSRGISHIPEFPPNLDFSAYNNNSFTTTCSLNHNTASCNQNCYNITNSNNVSNNISVIDDRPEILAWLSPLEPYRRHHDIQTRRVGGVGNWLLRTEEFRSWQRGDGDGKSQGATIFCPGNPGVGKTYIR